MSNDSPLISIITPVYNVSGYLNKCVESVRQQTYPTWELLLVDDGSSDGSDRQCDDWASRDERITALHNSHGGAAMARNTGLAQAKGDYLYFMDSDDWIEPDLLESLLDAMQRHDADIAVCGAFFEYPERTKTVSYTKDERVLHRDEALRMIISGQLPSYLWLLLLKREVVREPYSDEPCFEDFATGYKWFAHARRVVMTAQPKYHYLQREGSLLHSARRDTYLLRILHERHEYIRQHQLLNDDDNRAITLRNLLKLAKDFARLDIPLDERMTFITQVRDELQRYLPVPYGKLGLKRWLRLQVLTGSVRTFIRMV